MLRLVYLSIRYVSPSTETYNFYWHSGGGAHHKFLTTNPELLLKSIAKNALRYPNFRSILKKKFGEISKERAYEYFKQKAIITEAPKTVEEFMELLRLFIDLDWRILDDDTIEIATPSPGKLIGKGGRNVREIKSHLGVKEIKVTKCWTLRYDQIGHGNHTLILSDGRRISILPEEVAEVESFRTVIRNGKPRIAYLAPWKHRWLIDRTLIERRTIVIKRCGHEVTKTEKVSVSKICANDVKTEIKIKDDFRMCRECEKRIIQKALEDFDAVYKEYVFVVDAIRDLAIEQGLLETYGGIKPAISKEEAKALLQKIKL